MKFNFKIQEYQTEAVDAVTSIFKGQPYVNSTTYRRDLGVMEVKEPTPHVDLQFEEETEIDDTGFKNEKIMLSDNELLKNLHALQDANNIKRCKELIHDFGRCNLDIEMETGTGKTYVYIKTMFELNKRYGWSKFIVVVPSIAIREGVKKSFEILEDHFMEHYGKKARHFIYNSSNLTQLDSFSSDNGINVMIINTQAFASSLKEGGNSKESRIIYDKRDEFQSRRPIDVIKANNPIIIRDEPQKMEGDVTQKALKNFNPLFTLNYSATHKKKNNLVYVLDALDAYNKRLVKRIEVKGFEIKNLKGTDGYLYLENIELSPKAPPRAKIEMEIKYASHIKRECKKLDVGDSLYIASNNLEQYTDYVVSDIDPINALVSFTNGETISKGEVIGDKSETHMRRIQIRETILSHFEKEEKLFYDCIKTISLFFIDEVSKYRQYDASGDEVLGEYGKIFEEEYLSILNDKIMLFTDQKYQQYLKDSCSVISKVHTGYFSIDKKTKRSVNSDIKRGSDTSDDVSAYDLILKNKEQLLSFEEPTRFIFSHSALREGWDNPNVFQVCTLKHSDSTTTKRQEIGRGLRLCVNEHGHRMDEEACGDDVHNINTLTVIASESYATFVDDLQKEIKEVLYERPTKVSIEYFAGKTIRVNGEPVKIEEADANAIFFYLIKNDYINEEGSVTDTYKNAVKENTLFPLPEKVVQFTEVVHKLVQAIFDESIILDMFNDGNGVKVLENPLNDNFHKKEFQALWKHINHKYAYTVSFDSEELIKKSVQSINQNLFVTELQYMVTKGSQKEKITGLMVADSGSFNTNNTERFTLNIRSTSNTQYDLIGKIAQNAVLTRKTVVAIIKQIRVDKYYMFNANPEEFISKVSTLIKNEKASMVVEHISYNTIDGEYDSSIFSANKSQQSFEKAFLSKKHIQDYVFTDGTAEQSVEKRFAKELDEANEVCVYAKLPRTFYIPTPVGNYSPDWAIAFNEGSVKHIFFIAETKGTMTSMDMRKIETAKIDCAKKLFNSISTSKVRYHDVTDYNTLRTIMSGLD